MEKYFSNVRLPATIKRDDGTTVIDLPRLIQSHVLLLQNNIGKDLYDVFYKRLVRLKELIG